MLSSAATTGIAQSLLLRDVATIEPENHPAEADHYNIQRVVDVLVSPEHPGPGRHASAIQNALKNLRLPPA